MPIHTAGGMVNYTQFKWVTIMVRVRVRIKVLGVSVNRGELNVFVISRHLAAACVF